MNYRGVKIGKIVESAEDLMEHSYPMAPLTPTQVDVVQTAKLSTETATEQDAKEAQKAQASADSVEKVEPEKNTEVAAAGTVDDANVRSDVLVGDPEGPMVGDQSTIEVDEVVPTSPASSNVKSSKNKKNNRS